MVIHVRLPLVGDVHFRASVNLMHQLDEPLDSVDLVRSPKVWALRKVARNQFRHRIMLNSAPLLENDVLHSALNFDVDRGHRIVAVIPEPEFVAILVPVGCSPINLPIIGVKVEAVDRVREIRLPLAELVKFEVLSNESPDLKGDTFRDDKLQL